MSRPLRIEYPNAWYHVMNRGRRGEVVFADSEDFAAFVQLLQQSVELWDIRVSAYCLMTTHYHLLIQTPLANLSRVMRHINGVYTQYYNRTHGCDGALFRGRYKAILVEEDSYLLELVRYIHRNPLQAGLVSNLESYAWSSHVGYLSSAKNWNWLHKGYILTLLTEDVSNQLRTYKEFVSQKDSDEIISIFDRVKLPVILGCEDFVDWVKKTFFADKVHEQVPDYGQLAPALAKIKAAVCQYYAVDLEYLMRSKRGVSNEPRNVAVYLTRHLRRDGLLVIGAAFGMRGYSSVSSLIERVNRRLQIDKEFGYRLSELKQLIISQKSQKET